MPKKSIGFNATDEEAEVFEKNREAAGFETNAEFIKARCLNMNPSAQVKPAGPDLDDDELETREEKRQRLRISNVILGSLPIAALNVEELKRYVLVLDAILKSHKVDTLTKGRTKEILKEFQPNYTVVHDSPALPEKVGLLWCFEASCDARWEAKMKESRRKHMIEAHGWNTDKLISVGDL